MKTILRGLSNLGANRVVVALSVSRLGDALGNSILFIAIPLYVAKLYSPFFPFPETVRAGILLSLYGFVNTLCQPFAGALSDRFNRRLPFISGGMLLMAASIFAFSLASHYWHLLICRSLQGLGLALVLPASMSLMATATEKPRRGGAMGFYTTLRMVGFTLGPLIGGFLHVRYGFNAVFYAGAGFLVIGAALVQWWVQEVPAKVTEADHSTFRLLDRRLLHPGIVGLGMATFVMAFAYSIIVTLEKQFNDRLGMTALGFAVAFSALMVSRLLFQIPFGRLSDRIGRKPLIVTGLVVMAPATALLGDAASLSQLIALRIVQGVASAAIAAPAFALAADLSSAGGEGRQMSILTMGFTFGIAAGPLLSGILAVFFFELPFLLGGAVLLVGAWVVYRVVPETVVRGRTG
ncbi:MAG: MFS transporter [Deltaproteobacteria bacterium]